MIIFEYVVFCSVRIHHLVLLTGSQLYSVNAPWLNNVLVLLSRTSLWLIIISSLLLCS